MNSSHNQYENNNNNNRSFANKKRRRINNNNNNNTKHNLFDFDNEIKSEENSINCISKKKYYVPKLNNNATNINNNDDANNIDDSIVCNNTNITYIIYHDLLTSISDCYPLQHENRLNLTFNLCSILEITCNNNTKLIPPRYATENELLYYHTKHYINACKIIDQQLTARLNQSMKRNNIMDELCDESDFPQRQMLQFLNEAKKTFLGYTNYKVNQLPDDGNCIETNMSDLNDLCISYGIVDDCSGFSGLYDYMRLIAGTTLQSCELICNHNANIVMNLSGGRHHCFSDEASGFCYVNDIVIGIEYLLSHPKYRQNTPNILYIDIDIHHANAVESAFKSLSNSVFVFSMHYASPGFYPGSGHKFWSNIEYNYNKYSSLNIPLQYGLNDIQFVCMLLIVLPLLFKLINPSIVIFQCGCDGLNDDKLVGQWNLTTKAYCIATKLIQLLCVEYDNCPLLVLGGGGYNSKSVSRCWALIIATILNSDYNYIVNKYNNTIPDNDHLLDYYTPINTYNLHTKPNVTINKLNKNDTISLAKLVVQTQMFIHQATQFKYKHSNNNNTINTTPNHQTEFERANYLLHNIMISNTNDEYCNLIEDEINNLQQQVNNIHNNLNSNNDNELIDVNLIYSQSNNDCNDNVNGYTSCGYYYNQTNQLYHFFAFDSYKQIYTDLNQIWQLYN